MKFKPGDVVELRFERPDGEAEWIAAIVADPPIEFGNLQLCTVAEGDTWYGYAGWRGAWKLEQARLHPNPDKLWASYCAWRLTQ